MKRFFSILLSFICISCLSACGVFGGDDGLFRDRSKDYLRTGPIKKITLPEEVETTHIEPLYPIANVNATDEFGDNVGLEERDTPRPLAINSDEESAGVKIKKLGDERWIHLGASTSQVWPRTQSFLANTDVDVVKSDASAGLIETGWLQYSDNKDVMARFQIHLEKGLHPETTEISILEMELPVSEELPENMDWPERSTNPEREAWLTQGLAEHLAATLDNASASLLGQNVGGSVKAGFLPGASEPTLVLNLSNARAWSALTQAAKSGGFITWEQDRSKGVIYAQFAPKVFEKKGFLRRLFSFGRNLNALPKAPYSMNKVLQHLSSHSEVTSLFDGVEGVAYNDALTKSEGYLIVLLAREGAFHAVIRDHRGRKLPARDAKLKMRLLRKHIN